ncbi:cathepsin [Adoxophyes honmai nucleopolyhedrovirus]|uniref:Viral cathepsin n=1 Tax=Adoxophyes honmai nucleopolyhedrovirus TaxID=224399 RepID=CATV_NPVAH|nr:cathepsin [Adoxophyes honmai nucleopolyhedrovirus]Q80LP4.1 RecName: Full=Viral cathepsin; Short=V-cath; AltName: Full=Cysteine proteinase; Short=CP; Flags: Precursor [Adoxophyes honmai nucleopolyhedrovirus]BAC67303.1 cathepsin [Adoxophyes honmai nucleopolyhedrovirus]
MTLLMIFTILLVASSQIEGHLKFDIHDAQHYFETFIINYNKQYPDTKTKNYRFKIFKQNLEDINEKNKLNDSAIYNINKFSDLSKNELLTKYTGLTSKKPSNMVRSTSNFCNVIHLDAPPDVHDELPQNFDWRVNNKMTSVKDQGACGSCWAHAAVGTLETLYAIKHNYLINLSEQQLIDCDSANMACDGGLMHTAFEQLMNAGGLMEEIDYPYQGTKGVCKIDNKKFALSVSSCKRYIFQNEENLKKELITMGPIAMAIDAASISTYSKGIIHFCENLGLNHAVLLVGYGTEGGVSYWTLKNSWGSDWGEDGYFRVKRNINACGLNNQLAASATIH